MNSFFNSLQAKLDIEPLYLSKLDKLLFIFPQLSQQGFRPFFQQSRIVAGREQLEAHAGQLRQVFRIATVNAGDELVFLAGFQYSFQDGP